MRRVDRHADFDAAFEAARREAQSAFGDSRVLIERYVETPRHVEFQILADRHGRIVHLGERDCSLQRRHQKMVEESPAPGMTAPLRAEMGRAAVRAAHTVGYVSAGTVEFICDGAAGLRSGGFWFMEMNTRLQVEHPVTEAVTRLDLVEWQFRIAAGERLALPEDTTPSGHAVEARLYAEDPDRGFLPSPGRIVALQWPDGAGIRVDTGVAAGDRVPPDYDPMIAKIIAHGPTRDEALDRLAVALGETVVVGPRVNTPFLKALAEHPAFRAEKFDTGFIERHADELLHRDRAVEAGVIARGAAELLENERCRLAAVAAPHETEWRDPWSANDGFSLGPPRKLKIDILVDGLPRQAVVTWGAGGARVAFDGIAAGAVPPEGGGSTQARIVAVPDGVVIVVNGRQHHVSLLRYEAAGPSQGGADGAVPAPMNGRIVALFVSAGERVARGARVAAMEAMKMEHNLTAPIAGTVAEIFVAPGSQVTEDQIVLRITADAAADG